MRRSWTIRARTALVFTLTSMALTAAALVFVNLASAASLPGAIASGEDRPGVSASGGDGPRRPPPGDPLRGGGAPQVSRDPGGDGTAGAGKAVDHARDDAAGDDAASRVAVVTVVSAVQWQWSAVAIVGAGLLAGGLGWFVSRRMLRPVDRMTATAARISATTLHERIALDGPDDELRRLSRTVDDLLDRLETAFAAQRRFVAQASHELRTPLAVQRVAIQVGLPDDAGPDDVRQARERLLEENRRTEHLVESLLVLAEAERDLADRRCPLDLADIAEEVQVAVGARAAAAGITVTLTVREVPSVTGEPTLVRQAIVNLVENAIEYNVASGHVRIVVAGDGVTVENSGPVVPADVLPTLVEPFRRHSPSGTTRHSASGTTRHSGLGLSIVAAVVRAHGWELAVDGRPDGGLAVRIGVSRM